MILVICETKLKMQGTKLKVAPSCTVGQIHIAIRRRLKKLKAEEAIFLFFNGEIHPMSRPIGEIASDDGFVTVQIYKENVFGYNGSLSPLADIACWKNALYEPILQE